MASEVKATAVTSSVLLPPWVSMVIAPGLTPTAVFGGETVLIVTFWVPLAAVEGGRHGRVLARGRVDDRLLEVGAGIDT